MQRLLTTIVCCFAAQLASAQCVNPTAATPAAQVRPTVELIKTAAAGTRDAPVMVQSASTSARKDQSGDDQRHPTGRAMLLAAVALMSGIALRRASASDR